MPPFSSHQLELVERLCEGVAIIKDGRLVAAGRVEELRDRGAHERRVRVAVEGHGNGAWLGGVSGAAVVARERGGLLVRLDGADPDHVLEAARAAGPVRAAA